MVRGSDGLDYEDLTARLLGQPLLNDRNRRIQTIRAQHSDVFLRHYLSIYEDWAKELGPEDGSDFYRHEEQAARRAAYQHACIAAAEHDGEAGLSARERGSRWC